MHLKALTKCHVVHHFKCFKRHRVSKCPSRAVYWTNNSIKNIKSHNILSILFSAFRKSILILSEIDLSISVQLNPGQWWLNIWWPCRLFIIYFVYTFYAFFITFCNIWLFSISFYFVSVWQLSVFDNCFLSVCVSIWQLLFVSVCQYLTVTFCQFVSVLNSWFLSVCVRILQSLLVSLCQYLTVFLSVAFC